MLEVTYRCDWSGMGKEVTSLKLQDRVAGTGTGTQCEAMDRLGDQDAKVPPSSSTKVGRSRSEDDG